MKKVLFLIESLSGGGAEKVLSVLTKHINKKYFDITVCTITDIGIYTEEIKQNVKYLSILGNPQKKSFWGKIIYKIKYKLIYTLLPTWLIYKLFIPKNYDIEIAFVEGFVTKLLAASTNIQAKKIAWVHIDLSQNPWTQNNKIYRNLKEEQYCYSKFNQIICVSDTVKNNFIKRFKLTNVIRIYNPIDKTDILNKAKEICKYPQTTNDIKFITIGRLVLQKGYDRLLKVIKRIKADGIHCKLLILGEGEMYHTLSNYIKENDLSDDTILYGFQPNPYQYLKKADCFICSSRSEGFSLVIAEAMVLGKPIISTYCSGPNELLEEGKYGMLVENSEDGLYQIIKTINTNKNMLYEYSIKSLNKSKDFDIQKTIKEIENIIL